MRHITHILGLVAALGSACGGDQSDAFISESFHFVNEGEAPEGAPAPEGTITLKSVLGGGLTAAQVITASVESTESVAEFTQETPVSVAGEEDSENEEDRFFGPGTYSVVPSGLNGNNEGHWELGQFEAQITVADSVAVEHSIIVLWRQNLPEFPELPEPACDHFTADCDMDGLIDDCDPYSRDCNMDGTSPDLPPECDRFTTDCDDDGIIDDCDPYARDCDMDGTEPDVTIDIPEPCNPQESGACCDPTTVDCNENGFSPDCAEAGGTCDPERRWGRAEFTVEVWPLSPGGGDPIEGAEIQIQNDDESTVWTTDDEGTVVVTGLPLGVELTVVAMAEGFGGQALSAPVVLDESHVEDPMPVTFLLVPAE